MATLVDILRSENTRGLEWSEKVSYAVADMGFNFYWMNIATFLMIFYTDTFGISALAAGSMLFTIKIINAFTDPLIGAVADRTRTRFGRFRPYLIWVALPLTAAGVLTYTTPNLGTDGKLLWAYASYLFMMTCYTAINIPYNALSGVMSSDPQERVGLNSLRFIFAFSGSMLVNAATPSLVKWLGGGNDRLGWQLNMGLWGIAACGLFLVTFFNTRERPKLIGAFVAVYPAAAALGASLTGFLTRFFDKKRLLIGLMGLTGMLSTLFYFIPRDQIVWMFVVHIATGLVLGPKSPLAWAMYADTADYNEWRNGRRATALTFAAATFSQKLGTAVAAVVIGSLLTALGYVANATQTPKSLTGIVLLMSLIPAVFAFLAAGVMCFYGLDNKQMAQVVADLAKRRAETKS